MREDEDNVGVYPERGGEATMGVLELACITFFSVYTAVFLIGGAIASYRKRRFTKEQEEMLTPRERGLLRAPGLWLSGSLMLTWTGKYLVSGSVVSSLIVLVLAVNDGSDHIESIAFFSMIGIAMTCVNAFFKCESLAAVYRWAFVLADPYFVRYENRYSTKEWEPKEGSRDADFDELLGIRDRCERMIAGAYDAAMPDDEPPFTARAAERGGGQHLPAGRRMK